MNHNRYVEFENGHLIICWVFCYYFYRYSAIINETIDLTLKKRNENPPENLTPQDIFYVQVTRVHEFFKSLASVTDDVVQQEQAPAKASQHLLDIGQIILVCYFNEY